jgi:hypothetical protein
MDWTKVLKMVRQPFLDISSHSSIAVEAVQRHLNMGEYIHFVQVKILQSSISGLNTHKCSIMLTIESL